MRLPRLRLSRCGRRVRTEPDVFARVSGELISVNRAHNSPIREHSENREDESDCSRLFPQMAEVGRDDVGSGAGGTSRAERHCRKEQRIQEDHPFRDQPLRREGHERAFEVADDHAPEQSHQEQLCLAQRRCRQPGQRTAPMTHQQKNRQSDRSGVGQVEPRDRRKNPERVGHGLGFDPGLGILLQVQPGNAEERENDREILRPTGRAFLLEPWRPAFEEPKCQGNAQAIDEAIRLLEDTVPVRLQT